MVPFVAIVMTHIAFIDTCEFHHVCCKIQNNAPRVPQNEFHVHADTFNFRAQAPFCANAPQQRHTIVFTRLFDIPEPHPGGGRGGISAVQGMDPE